MPVLENLDQSQMSLQMADGLLTHAQVQRFHGSEGISQLFRFQIEMVSDVRGISPADVTGKPAAFTVASSNGSIRWFHGLINRFETVGEGPDLSHYRAELVPTLWLLTHRYYSRIFQNRTIPEIVSEVLVDAGFTLEQFEFQLQDSHPQRDYCVQYRETDFHFISRLIEEEGIYYFFEHTVEGCKLIIADSAGSHRPIDGVETVPFVRPTGMVPTEDHVFRFRYGQEVRTGAVTLRDYNYERPSLDLQSASDLERDRSLEFSDYPGNYFSQKAGRRIAQWRAEEFECRRRLGFGATTSGLFAPGRTFTLMGHPAGNLDGAYLLTKITYRGKQAVIRSTTGAAKSQGGVDARLRQALVAARQHQDQAIRDLAEALVQVSSRFQPSEEDHSRFPGRFVYHNGRAASDPVAGATAWACDPLELLPGDGVFSGGNGHEAAALDTDAPTFECRFECIPAGVTYRPQRLTPWPAVRGCQTAVIVGPQGEEIYTDEQGRVKVQFYWDREGKRNEHSSCWIRVSQPWAGPSFGGMAIPRCGQEVIIEFLEGDPDRPIITGRVYNGEARNPQDLPASKARTSIRSNSYPGGGGFNEITMDDTKGTEHFYEKAQYDKTSEIGNNRNTSVGVDSTEVIGNNDAQSVGNNKSCDVTNAYNASCDTFLLNAKTSITLQCGASRIHMNQAGFISITGTVITSAATVNNSMIAPMTEVVGAVMLTQAGAVVLIEGGATHVRGEILAALKGAKVNVIAGGDNIIQGAPVKIN